METAKITIHGGTKVERTIIADEISINCFWNYDIDVEREVTVSSTIITAESENIVFSYYDWEFCRDLEKFYNVVVTVEGA